MTSGGLVSVIVPFLNAGRFLDEAIRSVLAQTIDAWELILVDDGTTDDSAAIARRYAEQYPGTVLCVQHDGHQNRGISASRNLGIGHARGDHIAMLDADDVWLPHKLERQLALLREQPDASVLYGNTQYWHSWTGSAEDRQRDFVPTLAGPVNTLVPPPKLLTLYLRGEATVPCLGSLLVRREVIERVNGFEEEFRGMYEDQVFYAKVALAAPVLVVDEWWDRYRQHEDSCCARAKANGSKGAARLIYLNWLAKYLAAEGVTDPRLWQALESARWTYRHPILSSAQWRGQQFLLRLARAWRRT